MSEDIIVEQKYVVTGDDIHAYKNYRPPRGNNPHDPGESTGAGEFSLKSKVIVIKSIVLNIPEGFTKKYKVYAPYIVATVIVEGYTDTYYAWVVYEGIKKVALYQPKEEQKDSEEKTGTPGAPLQVESGQTSVVNFYRGKKPEEVKKESGDSKVKDIRWVIPSKYTNDLRPLYYDSVTFDDALLGVSAKPGGEPPELDIFLQEEIGSTAVTVDVTFWSMDIKTANPARNGGFAGKNSEFEKTETRKAKRKITILPSHYLKFTDNNKTLPRYRVPVEKKILLDVLKELNASVNRTKIGVAANDLVAVNFLYPVLQHTIIFLPGLFGSVLSVRQDDGNIEQAWPTESSVSQTEFDLLDCNEKGEALRPAIDELFVNNAPVKYLKVLDKVLMNDIIITKATIAGMLENPEYFPKVYTDINKNETGRVRFVQYHEVPFDWRLPLNKTTDDSRFADSRFPFLAKVFQDIEKVYIKTITDKTLMFIDEKITLCGHSTGGVLLQGLLSMSKLNIGSEKFASLIRAVFYMNVPSWGAPKAEQMMLNGFEETINKLVSPEHLRQIAANLPVTYMLAPNRGYIDPDGADLTAAGRKKRFQKAALGFYNTYPARLYQTGNRTRPPLLFNQMLADLADDYYELWVNNYTKDVPTYIFHFGCFQTISSVEIPDIDIYNSKAFTMQLDANNVGPIDKLQSAVAISALNKNVLDAETYQLLRSRSVTVHSGSKIAAIVPGSLWHLHTPFKRMIRSYIVRKNSNSELEIFSVNRSQLSSLAVKRRLFGDTTVPRSSQLGLYYSLKDSHNNIFVMPETKTVSKHMDGANPPEVWSRIFAVLSGQSDGVIVPTDQMCQLGDSTDISEPLYAGDTMNFGSEDSDTGTLTAFLLDANNNPYPAGTEVVLSDIAGTEDCSFYLSDGGRLELSDIPADNYTIKAINTV